MVPDAILHTLRRALYRRVRSSQRWIVIASAFDAETPKGGQGGGDVGPLQTNCALSFWLTSDALFGRGSMKLAAPNALLRAGATRNHGPRGSTQIPAPSTTSGEVRARAPSASAPVALGGALPQVSANLELPTRGIEVTEIASVPLQPGEERP